MTKYIYNYIFLSIFIHSLIFLLLILTIRNSITDIKSITYVNLIEEKGVALPSDSNSNKNLSNIKQPIKTKELPTKTIEKSTSSIKDNDKILEERISALQAKKKIMESAKISISKSNAGNLDSANTRQSMETGVSQSYLSLISGLIKEKWNLPETVPKNLEAIVTIKILPNGQAIIEGFEKKSGNALFDSSVIRAINNSTPLPRPTKEIIVGLRFKP